MFLKLSLTKHDLRNSKRWYSRHKRTVFVHFFISKGFTSTDNRRFRTLSPTASEINIVMSHSLITQTSAKNFRWRVMLNLQFRHTQFQLFLLSSGKVHYSIYNGNNDRKFQVNSSSGVVMLISSLDYEAASLRTVTIRASDSDPDGHARYTDFYLQVHIDDVNDNAPEFADSVVTVLVPETLSVGKGKIIHMFRFVGPIRWLLQICGLSV